MAYQRNQNGLLQRDYGCKWQALRFHFTLALGYMIKKGKTMGGTKSNMSLRRAGLVPCLLLLLTAFCAPDAQAQARLIVRDSLGLGSLNLTCLLTGCQVVRSLGDPQGQLFLITFPSILNPVTALLKINLQLGIVSAEIDQVANTLDAYAGPAPAYLTDEKPTSYYGATVWHGYVAQPATQLTRTSSTQSTFHVTGSGVTVAVIDTGVDPTNAVLDQRTVAVLDGSQYSAFGHGTMTAGIVHLVAPQAKIMPLKSFNANGTGYDSDILRAIYYAVKNGAKVINMSFDYPSYSPELANAIKYANKNGVVSVASAGNDGRQVAVYPGALPSVIDVASTSNSDIQSVFTNYGAPPVWMAAPGEGVVTTYPWGTYAAGWGTSFSTPFVAGTAALMLGANGNCTSSKVAPGLAHAHSISDPQLGYGRLDTYRAVQACH